MPPNPIYGSDLLSRLDQLDSYPLKAAEVARDMISRGYLSPISKVPPKMSKPSHVSSPLTKFLPSMHSTKSTWPSLSPASAMNSTSTSRMFPSPTETRPLPLVRSPVSRSFLANKMASSQGVPGQETESTERQQKNLTKSERRQAVIGTLVEMLGSKDKVLAAFESASGSGSNWNGAVDATLFMVFLKKRGIDWEYLTGYRSASSMLRLFKAGNGSIDVYDALDYPRPTAYQRIPTEALIDRYMRGVQRPFSSHDIPLWTPKDLDEEILRSDELDRCRTTADQKRKWIKSMFRQGAKKVEILAPHLHGITGSENDEEEIDRVIRGDIDTIRQRVRTIESGIRDFTAFRKEVERCRGELNGVSIEKQRRDEEEKRRQMLEEQRKQLARGLNAGTSDSFINHKMNSSSLFKMPTEAELVHYFREDACVDPQERQFRKLIKSLGISILEGEQIKQKFDTLDRNKNGRLDRDEFSVLIAEMLGFVSSNVPVPQTEVDKYWRCIAKDAVGLQDDTINFEHFLVWFRNAQAQRLI